jgi:hypothetical protein
MSNESAAPPMHGLPTSPATIENIQDIVAIAEQIIASGIEQIALVTIHVRYGKEDTLNTYKSRLAESTTQYLLHDLRTQVRKTDSMLRMGHTLYFLLHGANKQGGQIVQERLWEALLWQVHNLSEREMSYPQSLSIGHSSYPMHTRSLQEFVAASDEVMLCFERQPGRISPQHGEIPQGPAEKEDPERELPVLARKLGIPYLTPLPRTLPQSLQQLVTPELAQELRCYPVGRERNRLTVAMLNPADHSALDRLEQETGLHIFPVLTHPQALQVALEQLV